MSSFYDANVFAHKSTKPNVHNSFTKKLSFKKAFRKMLVKLTPGLSHFGEDDLLGADGTFPGDDLMSISTKILVKSESAEQISGVENPFSGQTF
jgi:hypothetical protein